jgi:hypothetical protein
MSVEDARRDAARVVQARRLNIPEWMLEMAQAVPTDLIRDIVADSRRSWSVEAKPQPARGSGWVDPIPLGPPPGDRWVNAQLDAADREWRADRLREEMERRKTLAELAPPEMPKADQETPRAPSKK